jgi:hypothetical protein
MAPRVGDKNQLVKMAQWVGKYNKYSRGDNETVWQYVSYGSFCMNTTYMNSMLVVVIYDNNYSNQIICLCFSK